MVDVSDLAYAGPTNLVLHELMRQLAQWRSLLPTRLQWLDNEIYDMFHLDRSARRLRQIVKATRFHADAPQILTLEETP